MMKARDSDATLDSVMLGSEEILLENLQKRKVETAQQEAQVKAQVYRQVSYLGLCFCILFLGFNVTESFATSIYPASFGFLVLMLVYAGFGLSCLLVPLVMRLIDQYRIGEKWIMFIASVAYTFYAFSIASSLQWLAALGAVICGLSAGFMWTSQGLYLLSVINQLPNQSPLSSGQSIGRLTGLFFSIFNANCIVGNLLIIALLKSNVSLNQVLWITSGLCVCACIMFIFVQKTGIRHQSESIIVTDNVIKQNRVGSKHSIMKEYAVGFRKFLRDQRYLLLIPYMMAQGAGLAFSFGTLPLFVAYHVQTYVGVAYANAVAIKICICFICYGFGSVIGSYVWGLVYDKFKQSLLPLLSSQVILTLLAHSLLIISTGIFAPLGNLSPNLHFTSFIATSAFILGTTDYLMNSVINNLMSSFSQKRNHILAGGSEASRPQVYAFSWYRFWYCLGFVFTALIYSFLPQVNEAHDSEFTHNTDWIYNNLISIIFMVMSVVCGLKIQFLNQQM
ncbi:hypothetical protein MP228_012197 [Amoeboaphelidium protococcarum]|nr:hypothetical protein MP228_012197 [Amoeboaphelidium protococcarum]